MPRKQTHQRGPRDEQTKKQRPPPKRKAGKILNALSIAEIQNPQRAKIRRSRLGGDDDYFKRKRNTGQEGDGDGDGPDNKRRRTGDDSEIDSNEGSDGEGRRWKIGVDSDNDSELDSDEAMGSSDEEKFEGFAFRGSSTSKAKPKAKIPKPKRERELNLSEGDDDESDADQDMDDGDDDDLGEDAIDLVAAWDMNAAEEEEEAKKASKSKKRADSEESDRDVSENDDDSDSDDDQDGSELSVTDDELGNEDGLSKLQSFVDSMNTESTAKPTRRKKSGQEHLNPTEFGLTSTRKLTVADLLSSVTDSRLKNSLKHVDSAVSSQKTSTGIPGKLDAPLAKRQHDRLEREAAYEKSKETLGRWIETVKANRRAEHLTFPLPDPDAQLMNNMNVIVPQNGLENTIKDILVESGLADAQGKSAEDQVQKLEELQARKLPIEEIQARRVELRKHRDLLFREEVRAKRIKKIKSKSYRRVHRKEQERMEQKERQALMDAGVDPDEQDQEKNERLRAEARMGNKHKESKWAKSLKKTGRTAWDEDARHGAVELAQREEELRQRIEGKRVSRGGDDYLGSSSESESENENPWEEQDSDTDNRKLLKKLNKLEDGKAADGEAKGPHSKLLSMKFMQNAEAARKAENDAEVRRLNRELQGEESQSEAESEVGRRKFGSSGDKNAEKDKGKKQSSRNEFEEAPGSDEEPEHDAERSIETNTTSSNKAKTTTKANEKSRAPPKTEATLPNESDGEEDNPWLVQTSKKNRRVKANDAHQTVDITRTPDNTKSQKSSSKASAIAPKTEATPRQILHDGDDSDDESKVPVLLKNHDLVKRAFAGDEVVQEFEQEKLDAIEEDGDKVIDETLPGWGSWAGDGVSRKEKKRQRRVLTKVEGIKPEKRKDAKLSRVIINEKTIKKNNKYLATQLPHPFESKQQYERSLRVPIGPEWSTKETFQSSTKPRVMVKQGVIKPMEKPMV